MAVRQSTNCLVQVLADGLSIRLFSLCHGLAQHWQGWSHHRQVDHIPVQYTIIVPTIGIREQLARRHIKRRQRGDSTNLIAMTRLFQCNAPSYSFFSKVAAIKPRLPIVVCR